MRKKIIGLLGVLVMAVGLTFAGAPAQAANTAGGCERVAVSGGDDANVCVYMDYEVSNNKVSRLIAVTITRSTGRLQSVDGIYLRVYNAAGNQIWQSGGIDLPGGTAYKRIAAGVGLNTPYITGIYRFQAHVSLQGDPEPQFASRTTP